jgi:hypothetical protein
MGALPFSVFLTERVGAKSTLPSSFCCSAGFRVLSPSRNLELELPRHPRSEQSPKRQISLTLDLAMANIVDSTFSCLITAKLLALLENLSDKKRRINVLCPPSFGKGGVGCDRFFPGIGLFDGFSRWVSLAATPVFIDLRGKGAYLLKILSH